MDIEIKKAGEIDGKEFGIDQYKNIYERYVQHGLKYSEMV